MGNEKERYSRSIGYSSDEPVQKCKDKSESLNTFSEEFEVNIGVHQMSLLSPLLFVIVVDVVTNEIKEGMFKEILYVDDIDLMAESMAEQQEKCYGWKSALESKGLYVNLMNTRVMESKIGQVTVEPSSKKDPCGICCRKTMLSAVLCKSYGNWIHGRCAKIKRVTNRLAIDHKCRKCKGFHENVEDQKEKLHDDVETVTEFSYLGDRINSGDVCESAVTSRTRLGRAKYRECQDSLC